MGDPATVIDQYRRYVQDGRLEISEVMASELSDLLLSKKGKSLDEQGHLVTALRDLAKIHENHFISNVSVHNNFNDATTTSYCAIYSVCIVNGWIYIFSW